MANSHDGVEVNDVRAGEGEIASNKRRRSQVTSHHA